jgi:acyl-lipid omega-6 desaturase (Delta-12 desaturase)
MTATTEKFTNASMPLLDADIQLKDIIKTLPRECFYKSRRKAWASVFINVFAVALGYAGIAFLPWYFLPITWIFTGTALTGFFVLAHDCGHRSFAKRRWVNDLMGHILTMPLIYPFHCWRILHDRHHRHTNNVEIDNAWSPWTEEDYTSSNPFMQRFYQALRGRFWWFGSIVHWGALHFDLSQFAERDRSKVKLSIATVVIFAVVCFPTILLTSGIWGLMKFWLLPWLVYHFWMSTFTLVHHTTPDVQFRPTETWNAARAQLAGTIHCVYPRWVEILCHDINVHIPHHVCVAIPSYNLRMAHDSLLKNWGDYMQESRFSWDLMREIGDRCHIYHPEEAYRTFKEIRQ